MAASAKVALDLHGEYDRKPKVSLDAVGTIHRQARDETILAEAYSGG